MTATNAIGKSRVYVWSKSLVPLFLLTAIFAVGGSLLALRGCNPSEPTQLLWRFAFSLILVCWVRVDVRAQRYSAPFDFDAFIFFGWPVAVPYYLYRTRGGRGFLFGAGIWALDLAPTFVAQFIRIVVAH
jgi:hypothetical protein